MFTRLLSRSIRHRPAAFASACVAVLVAGSVLTFMGEVVLGLEQGVGREARRYGPNLVVAPAGEELPVEVGGVRISPVREPSYLNLTVLDALDRVRFRDRLLAVAPVLYGSVGVGREDGSSGNVTSVGTWFRQAYALPSGGHLDGGLAVLYPGWNIDGSWPSGDGEAVLGSALARWLGLGPGGSLTVTTNASGSGGGGGRIVVLRIVGVLTTGGPEESQLFFGLGAAQGMAVLPGKVSRILLSGLARPDDAFARRDPDRMSQADYERWYCTPYVGTMARQVRESLPGVQVHVVAQVAKAESGVVGRLQLLLALLTGLSVAAAIVSVSATVAGTALARSGEVGLLKAMGAGRARVASLFLGEATVFGLVGGVGGWAVGASLALQLAAWAFGRTIPLTPALVPAVLGGAVAVALAGSLAGIRRALRVDPIRSLRGT